MPTGDFDYGLALRPRITIKTIDGEDTLYTFNAFSGSNPFTLTYADMDNAVGEAGAFNVEIADHDNVISKDDLHHVKVFLELGKSEASLEHFMIGYGDMFAVDRLVTNYQSYMLTGFGSWIQAYQLYTHRREKFKKTDTDAKIWKLIRAALTKRLWRPLKDRDDSIQDITGWDDSGISEKVDIPYTVFDKAFVYFGDVCDELCSISGAVWFIDYSSGDEIFTLTYNPDLHVNVNIKSGDLKDVFNDPSDTTSYILSGFRVEDNSTTEAGVATRLITTSIIDQSEIYSQKKFDGATTLDFRAIAQQVIIDNDARRLDSVDFILDKKGEPASPQDRVNGDIVLDVNNTPTGTVLDTFSIPMSQIDEHTATVTVADIDVSQKKLSAGQTKIWFRLFQRSGLTGDPTHDPDNTIKWMHDNIFNVTRPLYVATANEGDKDKKDSLQWNVTNQGPLYAITIKSNIRRLYARTNDTAVKQLRLREQFVPTEFLEDPSDVGRYLSLNLSQTSKPKRAVSDFRVTVPNNFLFRPYQWVTFQDGLSDIAQDLQIKRARYVLSSNTADGNPQIGTLYCNLTLGGLYNPLIGSCSCH